MVPETSNSPDDSQRDKFWTVTEWLLFTFDDDDPQTPGCLHQFADFVENTVTRLAEQVMHALVQLMREHNLSGLDDLFDYLQSTAVTDREAWHAQNQLDSFTELSRRLCYGYVVTVYSRVEIKMKRICDVLASLVDIELPLDQFPAKDKSIRRAADYMEKILRLKVPRDTQAWKNLRILQTLRNAVAHDDGQPRNDRRAELSGYAAEHADHFNLEPEMPVIINAPYLKSVVEQAGMFFSSLREANKGRLQELRQRFLRDKSEAFLQAFEAAFKADKRANS